jgi:cytochrome c2
MKNVFRVAVLTVLATLFYAYVGHMVPQKVTYPPEDVELSEDMTTEEMVKAGEEIVGGKGTCLGCHTIGSHNEAARFPDLGGIGARAGTRKQGMSDVEYLAESLYEPNAFIVPGFNPGMVAANGPPINLSDAEILSVMAYLQSLGGTPTVTMATVTGYESDEPAEGGQTAAAAAPAARPSNMTGEELVANYGCTICHSFTDPTTMVGPSLHDVGDRLSQAQLYESIMEPDATIAEGFTAGVMPATLNATQFYDKVTAKELKTIIDYLSSRKASG